MKVTSIAQEKLHILASGLIDGGAFNSRVEKLRKKLKIPRGGISNNDESMEWHKSSLIESDQIMESKAWRERIRDLDKNSPDYKKKHRELHREIPINMLTYEIQDIISEHPDLKINMKEAIRSHILFGDQVMIGGSHYQVFTRIENGKEVYGMQFYSRMSKKDFKNAVQMMELINKRLPTIEPAEDIERDLEILKLSKRKGEKIESSDPDLEKDSIFNDENIVTMVLPEELDTPENLTKNKARIRQRRRLADERLKKLFPNTYKGCEAK